MKKFVLGFLVLFMMGTFFVPEVDAKTNTLDINMSKTEYRTLANDGTGFDPYRDDDFTTNCQDFASTIRIGGYLLFIAKIALPLVLIVKSSMSLFSIVSNGTPDEFKKQASKLLVTVVAGAIIFFIPSAINVVFGFIAGYTDNLTEDSKVCAACIFEPLSSTCSTYAD